MSVDSFMSARLLCQRRRPRPSFLLLVLCIALLYTQPSVRMYIVWTVHYQTELCMYVCSIV